MGANGPSTNVVNSPGSQAGNQPAMSYSDSAGNYLSSGTIQSYPYIQAYPYIINQYPSAIWVPMTKGRVAYTAIVMQYVNGHPVYYCRVATSGGLVYGQLVPNEGCYLDDEEEAVMEYEVLIR